MANTYFRELVIVRVNHHYLDITSLESSYTRQVAGQGGTDLGQSCSISGPVDLSLALSPSLPFHLCVCVCVFACFCECGPQTEQLPAWALDQTTGRSMFHMWGAKQEGVRLTSNDFNMAGQDVSSSSLGIALLCPVLLSPPKHTSVLP